MKVKSSPFYFDATILRDGVRAKKQGTIGAMNAKEAMDQVHEMSKRWNRPLIQIDLYMVHEGGETEHIMSSALGRLPSKESREAAANEDTKDDKKDEKDDTPSYGYPYGGSGYNYNTGWSPYEVGTYYTPDHFATLKLPDTEGP